MKAPVLPNAGTTHNIEKAQTQPITNPGPQSVLPRPFGLLAEITYRCPLHCPYCSNPTEYPRTGLELTTADWKQVFDQASELGVMHVLFSGGEPLQRPDLPELVASARKAELYTNLITSGLGLTRRRAEELKSAGLDSIQISFQADTESLADSIAGVAAHTRKCEAARLTRELGLPLTFNVVLHRGNLGRLERLIELAEELGAERLELANTQFYGWAFVNKELLLPTRTQLEEADRIATAAKARLRGKMEVLYVLPDYYGDRPKPCMNGWGRRYLTVNPVGDVLPCPTSGVIQSLRFDNIRHHSLGWIWAESEAFNRFRGTAWMSDPCRSCDRREIDFGGCRCQAALLTGDPANTDPACSLSPHHGCLTQIIDRVQGFLESKAAADSRKLTPPGWTYRTNPVDPPA
jgi:pyrroloquinoline quinone biosynthesis protein E